MLKIVLLLSLLMSMKFRSLEDKVIGCLNFVKTTEKAGKNLESELEKLKMSPCEFIELSKTKSGDYLATYMQKKWKLNQDNKLIELKDE